MSRSLAHLVALLSVLVCGTLAAAQQTPLPLVAAGGSAYIIYRDPAGPPSVLRAASELQRVVKVATGVELPLRDEAVPPMICVGDNAAARAAGLTTADLPDDGLRMVTKEGNLYLLGKDYPEDKPPYWGWVSRGTFNAVQEFLERHVGARWLLPGEVGEDIPHLERLLVGPLDVTIKPDFDFRMVHLIQDTNPTPDRRPHPASEWCVRQRLHTPVYGWRYSFGHAWDQYIPQEEALKHPEWWAADETGKRRTEQRYPNVKWCTTNPEWVKAYAAGVIKWIDEHPTWKVYSISPSDGGDLCLCPNCQALVGEDSHGKRSYVRLILKSYNDIAKIVAQKYPDRILGGYVYYNYMYPPPNPPQMEPNVCLCLAPLNYYGYGLWKPAYQPEFDGLIKSWLAVTPNFVYHNYGNWMRSFNGAPLPVAFDLIKLEVPTCRKYGARGVHMLGSGAWGTGGPINYLLARVMWDANTDVDATFREWLQRAYGPGWEPMRDLYMLVEERFKAHKQKETPNYFGAMYEVNTTVAENVYYPLFADMERLYKDALAKVQTEPQKRRLEMFGDNLIQLHWGLRKAGFAMSEQSLFYRDDATYETWWKSKEWDLGLYRDAGKRYFGPIWKGEWNG